MEERRALEDCRRDATSSRILLRSMFYSLVTDPRKISHCLYWVVGVAAHRAAWATAVRQARPLELYVAASHPATCCVDLLRRSVSCRITHHDSITAFI